MILMTRPARFFPTASGLMIANVASCMLYDSAFT
jgi:hypothetical protein